MKKFAALTLGMLSMTAYANTSVTGISQAPVTEPTEQGWQGQMGLGLLAIPEYFGSSSAETMAMPLINMSYNDTYYMNIGTLGAWLYKNDNGFRAGTIITSHRGVREEDLAEEHIGYGNRHDSIMGGFNIAYRQGRFNAELQVTSDISGQSNGNKLLAQASYTFLATQDYTLTAIASVENIDSDMVDYYYDVDSSTVNYSAGLAGTYNLNQDWSIFAIALHTRLGDEISDSAIAERDHGTIGILGLTYKF